MNSKGKGSAFEREVCRKLSLWITGDKRKDLFWRSAMSGGRATVAHRKGGQVRQSGDITAVAPEGHILDPCYIECKFYRDLDITSFFLTGKGKLATFWRKTKKEAFKHEKAPWLIAKQNHKPAVLIVARNNHLITLRPRQPSIAYIDGEPCEVWLFDQVLKLRWPAVTK